MRDWARLVLLLLTTGCATGGAPEPTVPDLPNEADTQPLEIEIEKSSLDFAREVLRDGDVMTAAWIADTLLRAWVGSEDLDPGGIDDLVALLDDVGAEDGAARLLMATPFDLGGRRRGRLRDLAGRLSIVELQTLLSTAEEPGSRRAIVEAELARALALAGRLDEAGAVAVRVLAMDPYETDERMAEAARDGGIEPLAAPFRIGLVLPGSGRFASVGAQILQGALLAVEDLRDNEESPEVEILVRDDSSRVETALRRVEELEAEGVGAILGPVRTNALLAAARSRMEDDLLLLSPTASGGQGVALNTYSLWDRGRRDVDVARTLATWMSDELSLRTFGILHPRGGTVAAVEAAREAVENAGAEVVGVQAYESDSTTFAGPIGALAGVEPDAVIVLSDNPRTVLQIAPQLVYFGLRRWVTGGDANWSDPEVVRRLDASYADHRLVGLYVDRVSSGTPWQGFKARYETYFNKPLSDNMFVALGHDAMSLILAGAPAAGMDRRGAVGRRLRRMEEFRGATGEIFVDRRTGELRRKTFVRVMRNRGLVPPDPAEMREWAVNQRELEEFLRTLEEEKAERVPTGESGQR